MAERKLSTKSSMTFAPALTASYQPPSNNDKVDHGYVLNGGDVEMLRTVYKQKCFEFKAVGGGKRGSLVANKKIENG